MTQAFFEELKSLAYYIDNDVDSSNKQSLIDSSSAFVRSIKSFISFIGQKNEIHYVSKDFFNKHIDNLIFFYESMKSMQPKIILEMIPQETSSTVMSDELIVLHQNNCSEILEIFKNIDKIMLILQSKIMGTTTEEELIIFDGIVKSFLRYITFIISGVYI